MMRCIAALAIVGMAGGLLAGDTMAGLLRLETPKPIDSKYQRAVLDYELQLTQLRQRLAVRAGTSMKRILLSANVLIVNRGRAEAITVGDAIYIDIALLDLLTELSFEIAVANVKSDPYHQLEFNLAYAVALNSDKLLPAIDPHQTADLSEEQWKHLWREMEQVRGITFGSILAFILAHEMSHLELRHAALVDREFPNEASRITDNPKWIAHRRRMELEADALGARTCIEALFIPAQFTMWLDLNEIRRRYYGLSPEYPTSAQRLAKIQIVHDELISQEKQVGDFRQFAPLPPDRDVAAHDYAMFLTEYRRVREMRRNLLRGLDEQIAVLRGQGDTLQEVAEYVVAWVDLQKALLSGANNRAPLDEALAIIRAEEDHSKIDAAKLGHLLEAAQMRDLALLSLQLQLEAESVDWVGFAQQVEIIQASQGQLADGIDFTYLLTNTHYRWEAEMLRALQRALPDTEVAAKEIQPLDLKSPPRQPLPTFEERMRILSLWDGSY